MAVRRDGGLRDRLQPAAVDLDGEDSEVVLGVQVNGVYHRVGKRLEEKRPIIDEPRTTGEEECPPSRIPNRRRAGRETRHQCPFTSYEIEHDDLDRFLARGSRPEVRERDPT